MTQNNILVFVEQNANKIAPVSLELISEAQRLVEKLQVKVTAAVFGHKLSHELLRELGTYGCADVYYVDDPRLAHFVSVPYAKMLVNLIQKYNPQIVLFGATTNGRDVAPRVASALRCGLTADCTDLQIGSYEVAGKKWEKTLLQSRPAFGGNIIATIVSPESKPSMATVREGVMKVNLDAHQPAANIIAEKCTLAIDDFLTQVIEVVRQEKSVNLKEARIIVGVGVGAVSPESLQLIKELAHTLGAEIGCTRPAYDSGNFSWERQIGQTGVTVRPNLYIACGISGQLQHVVGVAEAKRIVAINKDPAAPIFKVAHYGIVGDVNDVLPKMIAAYKAKV